jgi:hypothetical protein
MIWLAWRQSRIPFLAGVVVVIAVAAAFAATRPALLDLAGDTGFAACTTACDTAADTFLQQAGRLYFGRMSNLAMLILFGIPGLIGVFWGAPLVARELETGTYRLVWNQTVSRTRWLAVKLATGALATAAAAGLVCLAVTWWASPLDEAGGWMTPSVFAVRGVVPVGYATFAFIAGVTVGMLLRRTVPAMAVTLVVVAAAMLASPLLLRSHLAAPTVYSAPLVADAIGPISLSVKDPRREIRVFGSDPVPRAWILSNDIVTSSGGEFTGPYDPATCGPEASGPKDCREWIVEQNLTHRATYLGPDKFWILQWRELGVFLTASALLAGLCFGWIRRRVA